jgi:hypothetical protein
MRNSGAARRVRRTAFSARAARLNQARRGGGVGNVMQVADILRAAAYRSGYLSFHFNCLSNFAEWAGS